MTRVSTQPPAPERSGSPSLRRLGCLRAVRWLRWCCGLGLVALLGLAPPSLVKATGSELVEDERKEFELKAAILFNFVRYTRWPREAFPEKDSPFEVAVIGEDPFGKKLDELFRDQRFGSRPILVRRYAAKAKLGNPQVLFFHGLSKEREQELLAAIADRPILTIGEADGFAGRGIVRLFIRKQRIAFQVSTRSMKKAGIKIGTELLRHAEIVER